MPGIIMLLSSEDLESLNRTESKDRLSKYVHYRVGLSAAITFEKSCFKTFCRVSAGMYSLCACAKGQLITSVSRNNTMYCDTIQRPLYDTYYIDKNGKITV